MTPSWVPYVVVAIVSAFAGVAIAGVPEEVPSVGPLTPPAELVVTTTTVPLPAPPEPVASTVPETTTPATAPATTAATLDG